MTQKTMTRPQPYPASHSERRYALRVFWPHRRSPHVRSMIRYILRELRHDKMRNQQAVIRQRFVLRDALYKWLAEARSGIAGPDIIALYALRRNMSRIPVLDLDSRLIEASWYVTMKRIDRALDAIEGADEPQPLRGKRWNNFRAGQS